MSDMSRWAAMGVVVTRLPRGQRLEPRETNVMVLPACRSTSYRPADHANRLDIAAWASSVGGDEVWSPMKQHSWANPWLPPVASPFTGPSRLPWRPSQMPPWASTKKL